jgi:hypothetical protein
MAADAVGPASSVSTPRWASSASQPQAKPTGSYLKVGTPYWRGNITSAALLERPFQRDATQ